MDNVRLTTGHFGSTLEILWLDAALYKATESHMHNKSYTHYVYIYTPYVYRMYKI